MANNKNSEGFIPLHGGFRNLITSCISSRSWTGDCSACAFRTTFHFADDNDHLAYYYL